MRKIFDDMPELTIRKGTSIGYRVPLAQVNDDIFLNRGNHYLLARNGRGKTTLLRSIAGTLRFLSGESKTQGQIQLLRDELVFDPALNARAVFSTLIERRNRQDAIDFAERVELDLKRPYGQLSFGNRHKISLIVAEFNARQSTPQILLLDEPFTGLDSPTREAFQGLWDDNAFPVLRLISCHPDFDSTNFASAILITDSVISLLKPGEDGQSWGKIKNLLH